MELKIKDCVVDELLAAIGESTLKDVCNDSVPDFLIGATNVYRTNEYIVKQNIQPTTDGNLNTYMISTDTYYLRTEDLDDVYETFFSRRKNIDGKRIPVTMYARVYID